MKKMRIDWNTVWEQFAPWWLEQGEVAEYDEMARKIEELVEAQLAQQNTR